MRFDLSRELVERSVSIAGVELTLALIPDFAAAVARIESAMKPSDGLLPDDVIPYYSAVWPAAALLARETITFLEASEPERLEVLELGSGLGVPSLIAASLGCRVTAVDANFDALELLRANAARNDVVVDLIQSDWGTLEEEIPAGSFDLILASDVLYEPYHVESFVRIASHVLSSEGKILLTDPCRWHYQDFVQALKAKSFKVDVQFEDSFDENGRSRHMIAEAYRSLNLGD